MNPLVSVVIPTYNRGIAVYDTVESALNQDLTPEEVEVIIIDDGSTDDTNEVLYRKYGIHPRVRLFSIRNGGVARARNFGLEEARGQFIAFLDHDDLWQPQKLRLQCQEMENTSADVVYCNWQHFDKSGVLSHEDTRVWEPPFGFDRRHILGKLLENNFIISMSIPLIRTAALHSIGGFDPPIAPCDDWDVWIRLAQKGKFVGLNENLVLYRQHDCQQSKNLKLMFSADKRTRYKHRHLFWSDPYLAWRYPCVIFMHHRYVSMQDSHPVYVASKEALFASLWLRAWFLTLRCLAQHPILFFSPQWFYLLKRLIQRDARHY